MQKRSDTEWNFRKWFAVLLLGTTLPAFAQFDDTNILVEEAVNHIYQQRYKQAHQCLQRAYERSPRHPGVHFNLARVFELTGNFQEALKEYQLAAVLDPSMVAARRGIARCTVDMKRQRGEEQAAVLERAAQERAARSRPNQPRVADSRQTRAPVVTQPYTPDLPVLPPARQPQQQAAVQLPAMPPSTELPPTESLRVPPLPPQAAQKAKESLKTGAESSAEEFIERGRYQQAIAMLESLLENDADNPRLHYLVGKAYSLKGDLFAAIKHLEEAIRVDEHFHAAYYLLAQDYSKVNLLDEALKNYQTYFAVKPQAGVAVEIARIYERMGRADLAREYYAKANSMNPGNPNLQNRLDQASTDVANDLYLRASQAFTMEDYAGAATLFEQALAGSGLSSTYKSDARRKLEISRVRAAEAAELAKPVQEGFAASRKIYGTSNLTYRQLADIKFKTRFTGPVTLEWRGYVARTFSRYGLDFLLMIKELSQEELDSMGRDRNDYRLSPGFNNQPVFLVSASRGGLPPFAKQGTVITVTGSTDWKSYRVINDLGQAIDLPAITYLAAHP
ncbi:tetratricopeptide repeat protein [Candidatus Ozemobacteraceae bacterium]|nr:tetratricopeptide repeat protein [Candidatus Ozemobacteraceae bacterium]